MPRTKTKKKVKRISFVRLRPIKGELVEVLYHYYPARPKLFALVDGRIQMSYAGKIATNVFNRINNEPNKPSKDCRPQSA